jgi:hypothetical protein
MLEARLPGPWGYSRSFPGTNGEAIAINAPAECSENTWLKHVHEAWGLDAESLFI